MQSQVEQETVQDKLKETQGVENGPESGTHSADEEKVVGDDATSTEVPNSAESCEANGVMDDATEEVEKSTSKTKTGNKEKKAKKGTPKGKQSPKSKKETKIEPETVTEGEKEQSPEGTQEEEKLPEKIEQSTINQESSSDMSPKVKIVRLTAVQTESSEAEESIVEIPIESEVQSVPSTSSDESVPKILEAKIVKDSPRRSTRRSVRHSPPKQETSIKVDAATTIVLDSDDSISVLEISRPTQNLSFGLSLRHVSGRPSLRKHEGYNRSINRSYTSGSVVSIMSTRSDSESDSQESKLTQSKYGLWGLFRSPNKNAPSQDSTTDNESTNRSLLDDSGNDSEATTEHFEVPCNVSFRKRKMEEEEEADLLEGQEIKKLKEDNQKNDGNSSGLFSIMTSPMNLFASKLRGDKGKSSTPVQVLQRSDMMVNNGEDVDIDDGEEVPAHRDFSGIQYGEKNTTITEKESMGAFPEKSDAEQSVQRRWCNIM
ncbi:hypothetical protein C0J52_08160 [Blattella germanica]|nr:hypothetical protein C0J52_08160 [Blattella germanica]